MKILITLILIAGSSLALAQTPFQATQLEPICADGVTAHPTKPGFWHLDQPQFARFENGVFATMHLRPNAAGEYAVVRVDPSALGGFQEITRFQDPIRDLEFHDGHLWLLFRQKIVSIDPATGQKLSETVTTWETLADHQAAHAFAWLNDRLVIAHGSKGMMIYDARAHGITQANGLGLTNNGLLLKAIDVTPVNDRQVAFAIENLSVSHEPPFPFNGILLMDQNGTLERYPYNRKSSGSLSNAIIKVDGDKLIINNWGILHTASLTSMKQAKEINVTWTPISFEINGMKRPGELLGDLLIENGRIVSCAKTQYQDPESRKVIHKGVVYY